MSLPRRRIAFPLDEKPIKVHPLKGKRPPNAPNGRKVGAVNKITKLMKEAAMGAMEKLGDLSAKGKEKGQGGVEGYLTHIARTHPATMMAYVGRFVPYEFKGGGINKTYILRVDNLDMLRKLSPEELGTLKAAFEGKLIEALPNANPDDYAKTLEEA